MRTKKRGGAPPVRRVPWRSPKVWDMLLTLYKYGELHASAWIRLSGMDAGNAYKRIRRFLEYGFVKKKEVEVEMGNGWYKTTVVLYSLTEEGRELAEEYIREALEWVQAHRSNPSEVPALHGGGEPRSTGVHQGEGDRGRMVDGRKANE